MAELHVQRKRNNYWWLWLLLALIIIAGALYYYFNYYDKNNTGSNTTTTDTSYNQATTGNDTVNTVSSGDNLWSQVNFDSPDTTYNEISDKKVSTKANAHFVIYTISIHDLFKDNNADLSNDGKESLKQVRKSIGERFHSPEIKIYDQTDTTRIDSLAMERANAVSDYLAANSKITKSQVTIYHPGEPAAVPTKMNTVNIVVKR